LDSNSSENGEVEVQMDELSEFSNNSRLHLSHSQNRIKQQLGVDAKADNIMLGSVAKIKVIGVGGGGGNAAQTRYDVNMQHCSTVLCFGRQNNADKYIYKTQYYQYTIYNHHAQTSPIANEYPIRAWTFLSTYCYVIVGQQRQERAFI